MKPLRKHRGLPWGVGGGTPAPSTPSQPHPLMLVSHSLSAGGQVHSPVWDSHQGPITQPGPHPQPRPASAPTPIFASTFPLAMALCPVHCLLTCSTLSAHIPGKSPPNPLSPGTPHSPPAPGAPGQALNLEHCEIPARLPSQGTKPPGTC